MQSFQYQTELHEVEYASGWLLITDRRTGRVSPVRLVSSAGKCITRGQFSEAARKFGIDRTCETFKKLAAKDTTWKK